MNETDLASRPNGSQFDSPYVGLVPYEETQAPLFFGRDTDCEVIIANLHAARLTLFYGPSGVGKSSVLRAGVLPRLRQRALPVDTPDAMPDFVAVYFKDWINDPLAELMARVRDEIERALPKGLFEPVPQSRDLARTLAAWTERYGLEILIILDQFEEYFLYRPSEGGAETFAGEFPKAVNRRDLPVHFLLSLREDALSRLDYFKGSMSQLFDTRLQITHLREDGAREAIRRPVQAYRESLKSEQSTDPPNYLIEPGLVEGVLQEVNALKCKLGGTGQGALMPDRQQLEIEAPYLQLVMKRIWQAEQKVNSPVLRLQTLRELGGADRIVREHLDAVMDKLPGKDQAIAAAVFPYLVTPVGTKIAHAVKTLSNHEYTGLPKEVLEPVLSTLTRESRILRPIMIQTGHGEEDGYEIFHDALAPAILDWRARYEAKRAAARAGRRGHLITAGMAMILLLTGGVFFWLMNTRQAEEVAQLSAEKQEADAARALVTDKAEEIKEKEQKFEEIQRQAEKINEALNSKSPQQVAVRSEVANLLQQIQQTAQGAASDDDPLPPRVYISIQNESQRPQAKEAQKRLIDANFIVSYIENVGLRRLSRTELRYFRKEDLAKAEEAARVLKQAGINDVVLKYVSGGENSTKIRAKHYELWFAAEASGYSAP